MKPKRVPTYPLDVLAPTPAQPGNARREVYLIDRRIAPGSPFTLPYRSDYYGVGICFQGRARVSADLEEFAVTSRCVLAMPPHTVKQWHTMSDDFEHVVIFFTKAFIAVRTTVDPEHFGFFESGRHFMKLAAAPAARVAALLRQLRDQYERDHPFRDEILRALLVVLLYELEPLSQQQPAPKGLENRGGQLTAEFKRQVTKHFVAQRHVSFYAGLLSVTPRHLSATVRDHTDKTAGDWIAQTVALEARVLLQDLALTIGQVADALHFPDQSSFGKFFKKHTGLSPLAYRKGCPPLPTF